MSKIVLKIHNSSIFIEGNVLPDAYKELRKQMSFLKKNYQFALKKRKGWDGRVSVLHYNKKSCKCYSKKTGMHFPTGLLSVAREIFDLHEIEYELVDNRTKPNKIKNYSLSTTFPARDYQSSTIEKACKRGRGIVQSATGSGKTFIAAGIISNLSVSPSIFYVPSKSLLRQAKDEFERFILDSGQKLEVGIIGAGKCDIKDVNIMTIQTAIRALDIKYKKADEEDSGEKDKISTENKEKIKELIQNAKLIIADETQHWAADTCQVISDASENAYYKYGLSVFSDSLLQLKGDIFEDGFIGTIEDSWKKIQNISDYNKRIINFNEYEIIDLKDLNIYTRGWEETGFCWKKINKIIRHLCNKDCYSLKYRGENAISLTEDHSLYIVDKNTNIIDDKYEAEIINIKTKDVNIGNILLQDNGTNYNLDILYKNNNYDIIEIVKNTYISPLRIRLSLKQNYINIFKKDTVNINNYKQNIKRSNHSSINIEEYEKNKDIPVKNIYCEDGNSWVKRNIKPYHLAYLFGLFIGDGWIDNNRIGLAIDDKKVKKIVKYLKTNKYISDNISIKTPTHKGKSKEIMINNSILTSYFKHFFESCNVYNKFIPSDFICSWDKKYRIELLRGLLDSNGHFPKKQKRNRKIARYTTVSKKLSDDVQFLIRSLGSIPSLKIDKTYERGGTVNGRKINYKKNSYIVYFSYNPIIGINSGKKGIHNKYYHKQGIQSEVLIKNIEKIQNKNYVYDLEMDGHPSFTANGVLVHNSATPWRDEGDDILIDSCFGKVISKISASFLIKRNYLVKPKIYFVPMNNMRGIKLNSYAEIYKAAIVENELRNLYIKNLCKSFYDQGRNILVLVKQIEHGNILESMIDNSVFLHGSKKNKEREDHFDLVRSDHKVITIASSILDEGVDLKALDTLILAGSGKCVHGSTTINTNNTDIKIIDDIKFLVKKYYNIKHLKEKSFYDIAHLNIKIDSTFGRTNINKFYYDGFNKIYKVSSKNHSIMATENHRLRIMSSDNRIRYKKIKDITTDDRLMTKTNDSYFTFFGLSMKYKLNAILKENFKFEYVTHIRHMGEDDVYDITTDSGNYVASGIVCHNSSTRALQRIGRVIRPYTYPDGSTKKEAIVIDFDDKCKYLQSHSNARRKIYKIEEEFEILDLDQS